MSPYFPLLQTHQPCWLVTVNLTQTWVILGEGPSIEEQPPSDWSGGGHLFSWLLTDVGGAGHSGQSHTWADSPSLSTKATWPSRGEQASQQPSTVVSILAPGSRFWSWILPQLPQMPSNLKPTFPPSVVLVTVFITATEMQTKTSPPPVDDRCWKRATVCLPTGEREGRAVKTKASCFPSLYKRRCVHFLTSVPNSYKSNFKRRLTLNEFPRARMWW